ncbi:MAG TPA: OmpA family protein [Bacteroidales bacterium]|nr:OmpA family protein [Bacteroidales bacterium]
MRILITGFVILVIWSFFSMWLYVDVLKPQTKRHEIVQPAPPVQNREADSLAKLYASMPKDLTVYFDFDKTSMLPAPGIENSLTALKDWMGKYPSTLLLVTGNTDFIGTPEYNMKLSAKRAETVKKFLIEKGFPADKLITGTARPDNNLTNQLTSKERAEHRRTEVTIKK